MIARLSFLAVLAGVLSLVALVWFLGFDFDVREGAHWSWLFAYVMANKALPPFFLWSLYGTGIGLVVLVVTLQLILSRLVATTLSGGRDRDALHGTARWAERKDAKAAGLFRETGVVVGGWPQGRKGTRTLRHDGPEHVLTFAPTRSGKGVALVLPTLLGWQESVLVLDIKGENYAKTAGWRASLGHRILKFDPAALSGSVRFNPLVEVRLGTDHEIADAQNIAMMIIDPNGKGLQDFWMKAAFGWLSAAILHCLYQHRLAGRCPSLGDVGMMLAAPGDGIDSLLRDMVVTDHNGREAVNRLVGAAAQEMIDAGPQQRSGVHSSVLTELTLYRDPVVARNIAASDFRIDDLMNADQPTALYLIVPPNEMDRLRPLLRVVLNLTLRRLMTRMRFDGVAGYRHRLLLMLDEFTSIGKLEIFERSLAFMAGYGLKAVLIVQDLSQLEEAYGRENGIVGNCHVRIAYAPNEIKTARVLSDMCGKATVVQRKRGRSGSASDLIGKISESLSETARPLLTPDECLRLKTAKKSRRDPTKIERAGDMLTFVSGFPPILGRQPLYFFDKTLLARSQMAPPPEVEVPEVPSEDEDTPVPPVVAPPVSPAAPIRAALAAMAADPVAASLSSTPQE